MSDALVARIQSIQFRGWPTVALRAVLVWTWAALTKIGDPAATVRAVRAYQLLPEPVVPIIGHALPFLELGLALLLAVGLATRLAATTSAVALAVFVVAVASVAARGIQIDCGCFGGGGGTAATHYTAEIARDTCLLVAAVFVAVVPRSPLSLDTALTVRTTGNTDDTGPLQRNPGPTSAGLAAEVPCPAADQERRAP